MATRDELYAKFGITAEAAQLFETALGTSLLGAHGAARALHVSPDREAGLKLLDEIDQCTLGGLLAKVQRQVGMSDDMVERFSSALRARNRLCHGFYPKHGLRIQTDAGRDEMMADLEVLHEELFQAWQVAEAMNTLTLQAIFDEKARLETEPDPPQS